MDTYRMMVNDGGDHFFTVLGEDNEQYSVEAVHRYSQKEEVVVRLYDKCLFEELVSLHILEKTPLSMVS